MLAKSLGISQLIYIASMLSVLEPIIQQTQRKLFSFLWKNKKERIKRQVICQPFDKGELNFPCFRTAAKALRLSWIGRLLSNSNDNWTAIPNYYLGKYGGLSFILNCNYSTKHLDTRLPLFYHELLSFFEELCNSHEKTWKREVIPWNDKDVLIDQKTIFWKSWYDKNVIFIKDLMNNS